MDFFLFTSVTFYTAWPEFDCVSLLLSEQIDEGGVRKEFFQLIVRELFNEGFGNNAFLP